ncbi:MAG: cytochrome oxidase subunit III [Bacteroidetes bacterium MedPE-SWsnd-G1]|nr:MAG: cytochrome oxidase subunit III [Bacteroidetes bacterium MedPE-SWsnd-G1]
MGATAASSDHHSWDDDKTEKKPFESSYGKMMMWFFILSDALTFSGFIIAYGAMRFKFLETWPIADEVFTHVPFFHGEFPMYYVAFMTFVLIFSSVTMVLAVDAGHKMQKNKVAWYMFATIIGGAIFVGSQAWEWKTFIKGSYGAVQMHDGKILQFVNAETGKQIAIGSEDFPIERQHSDRAQHQSDNGLWFTKEGSLPAYTIAEVQDAFAKNSDVTIRTEQMDMTAKKKQILSREDATRFLAQGKQVVTGANLEVNEYGNTLFADFFFFITGFHGFHVFSGIVFNIIIFFNVIMGTYEKRKSYEMVEKVGLYWHFVDLVWVFVFTFFYLV